MYNLFFFFFFSYKIRTRQCHSPNLDSTIHQMGINKSKKKKKEEEEEEERILLLTADIERPKSSMIPYSEGDEYPDCKPNIIHLFRPSLLTICLMQGCAWVGQGWVCRIFQDFFCLIILFFKLFCKKTLFENIFGEYFWGI